MHRKWLPSINDDRLTGYRSLQEILRESTSLLRLLAFAFQWITLVNVARWFSYREKVTVWRLGLLCSLERYLPCYIFLTLLVSSQFERNTKMILPIRMISGLFFKFQDSLLKISRQDRQTFDDRGKFNDMFQKGSGNIIRTEWII